MVSARGRNNNGPETVRKQLFTSRDTSRGTVNDAPLKAGRRGPQQVGEGLSNHNTASTFTVPEANFNNKDDILAPPTYPISMGRIGDDPEISKPPSPTRSQRPVVQDFHYLDRDVRLPDEHYMEEGRKLGVFLESAKRANYRK